MSHPPTFKRIGDLADKILTELEHIHESEADDKDTAQSELGSPRSGDGSGQQRDLQQDTAPSD